jgi:hypothetical protein
LSLMACPWRRYRALSQRWCWRPARIRPSATPLHESAFAACIACEAVDFAIDFFPATAEQLMFGV